MKKNKGSVLLEIMISMAIGSFLLAGALQVLLMSRINYIANEATSVVDRNGRLALEIMSSNIRMSGYRGCSNKAQEIALGVSFGANSYYAKAALDINEGLRGWEYENTAIGDTLNYQKWTEEDNFYSSNWKSGDADSSVLATIGKNQNTDVNLNLLKESDVLRLWFVEPYVAKLTSATSTSITVDPQTIAGFNSNSSGTFLLISDCEKSILVSAADFNSSGKAELQNSITSITKYLASMSNANVMMVSMYQYSIEAGTSRRPSLYLRSLNPDGDFKTRVELVTNVMNMQILYGQQTKDTLGANNYVTANEISDWEKVVSIRLWLLVENQMDKVISNSMKAMYYGQEISPGDNRARRSFVKTVALRNRLLGVAED